MINHTTRWTQQQEGTRGCKRVEQRHERRKHIMVVWERCKQASSTKVRAEAAQVSKLTAGLLALCWSKGKRSKEVL